MKNSLLKSIRFNMDDEADRSLYEWLSHLPRGIFSEQTKLFWLAQMEEVYRNLERDGEGK